MANGDEGQPKGGARLTQNGPRLAVQAILAVLAILLLLWLINIVVQYDDAVLPGLAEALPRSAWIGVIIFLLIVVLAVEILLLIPGMSQHLPEPVAMFFEPSGYTYMMGCSGCGTVFDIEEDDLEAGHFECPHCGRVGSLKDREVHQVPDIEWDACKDCGTRYQKFRLMAECPNCHLEQD